MTLAERRRAAYRLGHRAEAVALAMLMFKGYRPVARRFGGKGGEIDLIVVRGGTVVFVEVKARAALQDAAVAVTAEKRRLVARLARRWLAANPWAMARTLRFDTVFIAPRRWPVHVADAFPICEG